MRYFGAVVNVSQQTFVSVIILLWGWFINQTKREEIRHWRWTRKNIYRSNNTITQNIWFVMCFSCYSLLYDLSVITNQTVRLCAEVMFIIRTSSFCKDCISTAKGITSDAKNSKRSLLCWVLRIKWDDSFAVSVVRTSTRAPSWTSEQEKRSFTKLLHIEEVRAKPQTDNGCLL